MPRYIPNTEEDRARMMAAIGISCVDELFNDIPGDLKLKKPMDLPESMPEQELDAHMRHLAGMNTHSGSSICFLGAGVYDHFVPSIVRHVVSKSEFYTSYTPYQPEISQGMLQAIFEYQTMICRLTGMDVSNASMYDGATAVAEAAMMAVRATGRSGIAVSAGLHPEYREVLKTYAKFNGIDITEVGLDGLRTDKNKLMDGISGKAAVIIQSPNFFGAIEDVGYAVELAAKNGALSIACVDPVSLAILEPPGSLGADIAVGDGQPLGNPLNFGGPHFGFLAAKKELLRKMPGRIVGQTTDRDGRRGFVLTLQAREQHIRREKAVSNICSNQALNALAAAAYLSVMGKEGLKEVAGLCLKKSRYAYEQLIATGKFEEVDNSPFFKEFTVRSKNESVRDINERLLRHGIIGGLELEKYYPHMSGCWLVAVTEKRTRQEIDLLVKIAAGGEGYDE
ncbi:MAG: aminomethyl-transferring glycine dehydrogenase subunit GcvPA [Acetivibrionales bacterium]|jgi:glycine dehydrogenase subunit 1